MPDSISSRSRRSASKQPVEAMATQLKSQAVEGCAVSRTSVVMPAYWAVPRLELRVKELVNAVIGRLGFCHTSLFPGGITDAIAQSVEELKFQFPDVSYPG